MIRTFQWVALCVAASLFCLGAECGGVWKPPPPPLSDCSDGIDNDEDGLIDFPDDLGCSDENDKSELPTCSPEMMDPTDGFANEFDLMDQANAELGEIDTDSEAGWIAGAARYWELKQCDPN